MMKSRLAMAQQLLDSAHQVLANNVRHVTLAEALFVPPGGYRSILGTLKHAAGWSHVYRSYAFDAEPKHWEAIAWPHGLRDTVIKSEQYLADLIQWLDEAHQRWQKNLGRITDEQLDEPRPLHWGQMAPLYDIVLLIAQHYTYHAGEINQLLSIARGEAWEEGEEVEENHISTVGHGVFPPWMKGE